MSKSKKAALFICLGNICRSPIAEAVFLHTIEEMGKLNEWEVDSAALGSWHVGGRPDRRASKILQNNGIDYSHRVRQITKDDFNKFDFIFGMDESNMRSLNKEKPPGSKAQLILLGSFDPQGERIIRDPYYDDNDAGFEKCYQQCIRSCRAFLEGQP
ncbi:low molecular weight phosphotyrosine protein phosphatase 1-like [Zootermopsis nevadensis]|uniref:Low molecular weight phosphotyrosine protein phosphatase n=1 Tax=Zootermopsis nevadensis TaxID=136037 RepID=A0A067QXJ3_ZOONE|nr:low molecular weight phosphotyrosine protein phosphatase 1-like [Zootermopsis nevadensis]KDR14944.1 Low molecular weight phosphotyrosine protein phosphatase [Zootermopsis nevadensis]